MFRRLWIGLTPRRLVLALMRPQMFAFMPALILAAYWYGGEGVLTLFALTFPMVLLILGLFEDQKSKGRDPLTGLVTRASLVERLQDLLERPSGTGPGPIALSIQIDDAEQLRDHLGTAGFETVLVQFAVRLTEVVRDLDMVGRLGEHRFGIALDPPRGNSSDIAIAMADRVQAAVSEAFSIDAASVYVTASTGFCVARRAPGPTGASLLQAAEIAMDEARRAGPASVRAFSAPMGKTIAARSTLASDLTRALEAGELKPWFQPQISTDTGEVTGFEALARWHHPGRGIVPPSDFLPALEASGQLERLGQSMLFHGLSALRAWDRSGYGVERIGVNFSTAELRNPKLVERISWELDRFDLTPNRLSVEILETVVAGPGDDTLISNIAALAALGCGIDLDDFGTGHASIGNIRRFSVTRLKIDRSFVTHIDSDPAQNKIVAAIISMAEQLDLDTVAEGVETVEEHALLAQMGCGHVQGFGIARPMPFDDTIAWLERHRCKLAQTPRLGGAVM